MNFQDVVVSLSAVVFTVLLIVGTVETVKWCYALFCEVLDGSADQID